MLLVVIITKRGGCRSKEDASSLMSYSDFLAKSVSVLMRSVAFGDYHNEMTKVTARMMTMVRTRTKTKIMTMTKSYSEFPARPGSQVARLDFDIGAALVEGQRF